MLSSPKIIIYCNFYYEEEEMIKYMDNKYIYST